MKGDIVNKIINNTQGMIDIIKMIGESHIEMTDIDQENIEIIKIEDDVINDMIIVN